MHDNGYYHGNLNLENIILSSKPSINQIFLINPKFTKVKS